MPDLATIANPFPARLNLTTPLGAPFQLPWSCHAATCAWLYEAEFSRPVTGVDYDTFFPDPQAIMTNLVNAHGAQVPSPISDISNIPRGSLLVFRDSGGAIARHSCVMKTSHYIVGYNQEGWFTGRGEDHGFSMHSTSEICWVGGDVSNRSGSHHYNLMSVPQNLAVAFIQNLVTGAVNRRNPVVI
jgi:hypothetical protein